MNEGVLAELLETMDARMERISEAYLMEIGRQIKDIGELSPSSVHRLIQMRRLNRNLTDIERRIMEALNLTMEDIEKAYAATAKTDARIATKLLGVKDASSVTSNAFLRDLLRAQYKETAGAMQNIANTTVFSKPYRNAIDEAITLVSTGVEDYGKAIRRAIRETGGLGLRVQYESGARRRLDSAVRMNVLDGARRLSQNVLNAVGEEYGANGIEIDAHPLCADDHLPYQGKQYSNAQFEQLQASLPRPFGEWNCRHTWHPIILGVSPPAWSGQELRRMDDFSTQQIEIDGVTKSRYEWSQEQRRIETAIRQQKDTAAIAKGAGDDALKKECRSNITQLKHLYERVSKGAGLEPEYRRTYMVGGRDAKAAATSENKASDAGTEGTPSVDWASANSFASGDARLTNMLRSGDVQKTATAVHEILDGESYGFRESKWSGRTNIGKATEMKDVLGRKEWNCNITIREDNLGNLKTYIHEDLHSRSASWFSPKTYLANYATEEGSVELMSQQICKRAGIPFSKSYATQVDALKDLRTILHPQMDEYEFAKKVFDIPQDSRYTMLVNEVNAFRIENAKMRTEVRNRLREAVRVLGGVVEGRKSYER